MQPGAVIFLQNAWSPFYAGATWPRPSWLRALERSRSGQRLRLFVDDFDICENTTAQVGAKASSVLPPDVGHITAVLKCRMPRVVVTCGKQAEDALTQAWPGALLVLPHPAYRVVTNALYVEAGRLLESPYDQRLALRQGRNGEIIRQVIEQKGNHGDV